MTDPDRTPPAPPTSSAPLRPPPLPAKLVDGAQLRVPLSALHDNPFQPRTAIDDGPLAELVAAIQSQGLLQPIAVRPQTDGSFTIVAGHRRVAAFRRLHDAASTDTERRRYESIPALVMLNLDDAQLAVRAYQENVARAGLTPLDEAQAVGRMLAEGLADGIESLATLTGQPVMRLKRLRRLAAAPEVVKTALSSGLMVVVSADADGTPRKELRRLDFHAALACQRFWEHLAKTSPKKADERTENLVRRSLEGNWGKKRVEDFVDAVVKGKAPKDAESEAATQAPTASAPVAALFTRTPWRMVIDIPKVGRPTAEQVMALRGALYELLAELTGELEREAGHR